MRVACLPVLLLVLSVLLCLLQSAAVSRIMSRTYRSRGRRLEVLRKELWEKERFMSDGYQSFQYLLEALKSSGHSQCTTVWTKDTVAYRCRTCQINDSRSASAFAFVFFRTTSISPPPPHPVASSQSGCGWCFFLCFLSTVFGYSWLPRWYPCRKWIFSWLYWRRGFVNFTLFLKRCIQFS